MSLPSFFPDPQRSQKLIDDLLERVKGLDPLAKKRLLSLLEDEADLPLLDKVEREYREKVVARNAGVDPRFVESEFSDHDSCAGHGGGAAVEDHSLLALPEPAAALVGLSTRRAGAGGFDFFVQRVDLGFAQRDLLCEGIHAVLHAHCANSCREPTQQQGQQGQYGRADQQCAQQQSRRPQIRLPLMHQGLTCIVMLRSTEPPRPPPAIESTVASAKNADAESPSANRDAAALAGSDPPY